jgi:hypothetical protein
MLQMCETHAHNGYFLDEGRHDVIELEIGSGDGRSIFSLGPCRLLPCRCFYKE